MKKFLPLFLLCAASGYAADVAPTTPFIHVSGEAKAEVQPDEVGLTFSMTGRADTYDDALKSTDARFAEFLAFLAEQKIPKDAVTSYQITVSEDRSQQPVPVIVSPPPIPVEPLTAPAAPISPGLPPMPGGAPVPMIAPAAMASPPMSPAALATQIMAAQPMIPTGGSAAAMSSGASVASAPPVAFTTIATMGPNLAVSPGQVGPPGTETVVTYLATRNVDLLLKDLTQFPAVYDKILALETEGYVNVQFKTSHEDEIKKKLLLESANAAKAKAAELCASFGMELDGIHAISEQNFNTIENNFIPQDGLVRPMFSAMMAPGGGGENREYLVPKTLECDSQIFVIFKIKEKK